MKKKLTTTILAATLIIVLAGCGSASADSGAAAAYGETDTAADYTETATADADMGYTEEAYSQDTVAETADASDSFDSMEMSESVAASGSSDGNADNEGTEIESEGSADSEAESSGESESSTENDSYEQKLIRTVSIDLETTEFDNLIAQLETKTEELGGYVESSEVSSYSSEYISRYASLTVRVPAASLDEFVTMVGENANVTYTSETTEDVTLTYVDLESHLTALRTEQESLLGMLEAAETTEDIIAIQSQLTEVRYEIESYESQLRVYDNKVDYSTVYLYIDEVKRETSAAGEKFWGSVGTKFRDNLYHVGQFFRNFAINFLGALPIVLAIVVPAGLICFAIGSALKRRQKRLEKEMQECEEEEEVGRKRTADDPADRDASSEK